MTRKPDTGLWRHIVTTIDVTEEPNPLVLVLYTSPMSAAIYAALWIIARGDKRKMRQLFDREIGKVNRR